MTLRTTNIRNSNRPQNSDAGSRWESHTASSAPSVTLLFRGRYADATDELVEVIRFVCRRKWVSFDEETDFVTWVVLRLLETDYALFKKFEGRSRLRSYLITAVRRMLLDYRVSKWGKYTPSAVARRLGSDALALERYAYRDGFTPEEAVTLVKTNHASARSEAQLSEILRRLPPRYRATRSTMSLDAIEPLPAERGNPEEQLIEEESRARRRAAREIFISVLDCLTTFEKKLLELHFVDGVRLREVAKRFAYPEQKLYRDFARVKRTLRERLEARGVGYDDLTRSRAGESDELDDGGPTFGATITRETVRCR